MKKVSRKRMDDSSNHNVWRSYSDMMSGLLLLFVLIMAVCLMQAQKNYTEKLAEQAKQLRTQSELEQSQRQVDEQQAQLAQQQATLDEQKSTLDEQENTLAEQASALEELQRALENQELVLTQKESELDESQAKLDAQSILLKEQEDALTESKSRLDEANALMIQQQNRIDQIIGVKADLIEALNQEFQANRINVQIDTETGAILLDSSVLFDYNESLLTQPGQQILNEILPVYCRVLLGGNYAEYVAEIIIDGYTDSTGDYITNLDLSQRRAYAVAEYLYSIMSGFLNEEESAVLMSKLTANGKSSSNLIYDASGKEDMDASRRVEVKFRLKDEEMLSELQRIIEESQAQTAQQIAASEAAGVSSAQAPSAEASGQAPSAEASAQAAPAQDQAAEGGADSVINVLANPAG